MYAMLIDHTLCTGHVLQREVRQCSSKKTQEQLGGFKLCCGVEKAPESFCRGKGGHLYWTERYVFIKQVTRLPPLIYEK